jgi:urease accessory protein UreE
MVLDFLLLSDCPRYRIEPRTEVVHQVMRVGFHIGFRHHLDQVATPRVEIRRQNAPKDSNGAGNTRMRRPKSTFEDTAGGSELSR